MSVTYNDSGQSQIVVSMTARILLLIAGNGTSIVSTRKGETSGLWLC